MGCATGSNAQKVNAFSFRHSEAADARHYVPLRPRRVRPLMARQLQQHTLGERVAGHPHLLEGFLVGLADGPRRWGHEVDEIGDPRLLNARARVVGTHVAVPVVGEQYRVS